jgi:hypothetical protein
MEEIISKGLDATLKKDAKEEKTSIESAQER